MPTLVVRPRLHCSLYTALSLIAFPGRDPGTQYYVLLYDSNRHRLRTSKTKKRSCYSRNQRQLQRRWTQKGLRRTLVQLQQLPSLPSLEIRWTQTRVESSPCFARGEISLLPFLRHIIRVVYNTLRTECAPSPLFTNRVRIIRSAVRSATCSRVCSPRTYFVAFTRE